MLVHRLVSIARWVMKRDHAESDLDQELQSFLDMAADDHLRAGVATPAEARRLAVWQLGGMEQTKEHVRAGRYGAWLDVVARDVRFVFRTLTKDPGFAVAVVLTLALGIGGNTAVFSVVDQLLLRPLPYPDGDQLVMVEESRVGPNSRADVSPANWLDWQRESRTVRRFAAWLPWTFTVTGVGEPRRMNAQLVSSEFFPLLGVAPLLGRTISD